jgi:hypothetical protein
MSQRILFPACLPALDERGLHRIGGRFAPEVQCPNCDRPMILHLLLNGQDVLLRPLPLQSIPVWYCLRCALSWEDFAYVIDQSGSIEIVKANRGPRVWRDWYPEMADHLAEVRIELLPAPLRLQELEDELEKNGDLDETCAEEFNRIVGRSEDRAVDMLNQVGGRAFLIQRLPDPTCPNCRRRKMYFLASLCNDASLGIKIAPMRAAAQVVAFFCPPCTCIVVQHSM